jgi:hypothetical protein
MGTDAIAAIACAAAQVAHEKQAGIGTSLGRGLDWAGRHLLMGSKGGLSLPKVLGVGGAGVAGADVLSGMKGGWGGTGGEQWHPWSDPSNWVGNLLGHPVRSLRELTGHGEQGPAYETEYGPETVSTEQGQMVSRRPMTPKWSPRMQADAARAQQMQQELQQRLQRLAGAGYPGFGPPNPGMLPQPLQAHSRYAPPGPMPGMPPGVTHDIPFTALNAHGAAVP